MERKRPPVKTDGRENIYIKEMVFKKAPTEIRAKVSEERNATSVKRLFLLPCCNLGVRTDLYVNAKSDIIKTLV